ncbi:MAG: MATE family efflux transporter [Verrucomicrobiota bacterium]
MDREAGHNGEEVIPPLHSKTVKTVLNIFILKCFSLFLTTALYWVIALFFGAEAVGAFGFYFSFVTIGVLVASFGFGNAVLKLSGAISSEQELVDVSQTYRIMLRLAASASAVLSLLILILAEYLAEVFLDDGAKASVFYSAAIAILPFSLLEISSEVIRGRGKTNLYMIFKEAGIWVVAAPILFFLLSSHYGYMSPIFAHLIGVVILSVLGILVTQELLKTKEGLSGTALKIKSLLKLSFPMQMSKGLNWSSLWIDILIIGPFVGPELVGAYLILNRVAAYAQQISYSINVYVAPRIAYHYQQKRMQHLSQLTCDSVRYGVWIVIPFIILLGVAGKPILGLFDNEGNEVQVISHYLPFVILLLANFVDTSCGPVGYLLNMTGKEQSSVHIMVTTTIVRIIFLLVLVGYFEMGLLGAALAHLGFVLVWNIVSLVVIQKHLSFIPAYIPLWKTQVQKNR